ncbi:MAG: hypothetical protein KDN22_21675 [Verrucomicrobiae bacterium]|nr:hypothetical protein [Verrucomicrobiae bacterium]
MSAPAYTDLGEPQHLAPLFTSELTIENWETQRIAVYKQWQQLLGMPSFNDDYDKTPELIDTFDQPNFRGTLWRQPTGPDTKQLVLIMEPKKRVLSPRPVAVVPFYHPDAMAGFDLEKQERITTNLTTQFGWHLVQQGYVVACTEAFPFNLVPRLRTTRASTGGAWPLRNSPEITRNGRAWANLSTTHAGESTLFSNRQMLTPIDSC